MNSVSLALRNLFRNRRRSLTTLLAMVIGLAATLVFGGYRSNINYGLQTAFIQASGHLQIQHEGYFLDGSDNPTAYGIADYRRLIDAIRADPFLGPRVTVVTPSLQLGGIAGNFLAGVSRSVMASGIVPEERNRQLAWNEFDVHSYARPLPLVGTPEDSVVIGTGVARRLRLCAALEVPDCRQAPLPGDTVKGAGPPAPADLMALSELEQRGAPAAAATRIEILAATARGAPNVASLNVIEARNVGIKALDDMYLAMHLEQAQRLIFGSQAPMVTAIVIQLGHTADLEPARARLAHVLAAQFADAGLEILDFRTLNPIYGQSVEFMDSMFSFVAILIGVIVLFTIGNTMSTAVIERTSEIGTLRALGVRRASIRRLFLLEGMLLAAAGAVLGVVLSLVVAFAVNRSGMSWTPPGYSHAYLILVRIWQDPALVLECMVGLLGVTLGSAWWPAGRAADLVVVDALRHNT